MKYQGLFNDTPAADKTAAAPAAPEDAATAVTEAAESLKNAARAAVFGERVDARVEDSEQHEARPQPLWDDAKPFPSYQK